MGSQSSLFNKFSFYGCILKFTGYHAFQMWFFGKCNNGILLHLRYYTQNIDHINLQLYITSGAVHCTRNNLDSYHYLLLCMALEFGLRPIITSILTCIMDILHSPSLFQGIRSLRTRIYQQRCCQGTEEEDGTQVYKWKWHLSLTRPFACRLHCSIFVHSIGHAIGCRVYALTIAPLRIKILIDRHFRPTVFGNQWWCVCCENMVSEFANNPQKFQITQPQSNLSPAWSWCYLCPWHHVC